MGEPRPVFGTGFFYALIGGFFLAFFMMGVVNIGHCPGSPTPEVLACREGQKRIGLFFPAFYLAVTILAVLRHRQGRDGATGLALLAGPIATAGVLLVNGFAR